MKKVPASTLKKGPPRAGAPCDPNTRSIRYNIKINVEENE